MAEYFFGITDTGRQRDNNEDAFIAERVLNDKFLAAGVIDGVGGYEGGEVAAAIAKESIIQYFTVPSGSIPAMIQEAVVSANEKIYNEKLRTGTHSNMACVLTIALVNLETNVFYYAHVGDTRLYLLRDGSLVKVTKDQSFVGFLEDSGRLTEAEAMAHPKRNEINKALGFEAPLANPSDYIERGESPFLPGDMLLLCSDGLSDLVNRAQITEILTRKGTLAQKGSALVDAANEAGGKDNITVVLVQNAAKPAKLKAPRTPIKVKKNPPLQEQAEPQRAAPPSLPAQRTEPSATPASKGVGQKGLITFLILFSLASLGVAIWQWQKARPADTTGSTGETGLVQQANFFQDTITGFAGDTLLLSRARFGDTVRLSDTLYIEQDFLAIRGDGNVITGDTAGGARDVVIQLASGISRLYFDSVEFRNCVFLVTPDNRSALQFRATRFNGSSVQVRELLPVPDTLYSGSVRNLVSGASVSKMTTE
jgi:serine/threonine protein phosphatase PrpC